MCKKNKGDKKIMSNEVTESEETKIIIEKDIYKTKKQRILHFLCLLLPIIGAFAGYFLAPAKTSEIGKFLLSVLCFSIPALIIFICTRKETPIIKIMLKDALVLTY